MAEERFYSGQFVRLKTLNVAGIVDCVDGDYTPGGTTYIVKYMYPYICPDCGNEESDWVEVSVCWDEMIPTTDMDFHMNYALRKLGEVR